MALSNHSFSRHKAGIMTPRCMRKCHHTLTILLHQRSHPNPNSLLHPRTHPKPNHHPKPTSTAPIEVPPDPPTPKMPSSSSSFSHGLSFGYALYLPPLPHFIRHQSYPPAGMLPITPCCRSLDPAVVNSVSEREDPGTEFPPPPYQTARFTSDTATKPHISELSRCFDIKS